MRNRYEKPPRSVATTVATASILIVILALGVSLLVDGSAVKKQAAITGYAGPLMAQR